MLTLIEFLEEIEQNHQKVVLGGPEVERLVQRFGPAVRTMGIWNQTGDGSVEIPMSNITEAVKALDDRVLADAVRQLKTSEQLTDLLNSGSAAKQLIEALSQIRLQQFQRKVEQYQDSKDADEIERLRLEISRELFAAQGQRRNVLRRCLR